MFVVITYDVATTDAAGRKRLRHIAKACQDWGQRVQYSVFECNITQTQWVGLRARILKIMKTECDSVRFYILSEDARSRIEHHGVREPIELDKALIV